MFTEEQKLALEEAKFEYDFVDGADEVEQPIQKPIVKIGKTAVIFTVNDLYRHRQYLKGESTKENQVIADLEKDIASQSERLEKYNEEFGVKFQEIFWQDKYELLADILKPENVLKIFEAFDIVRYIKGFRERMDKIKERVAVLDKESARLDKEVENVNKEFDIEHLERQYQAQKIMDEVWKK